MGTYLTPARGTKTNCEYSEEPGVGLGEVGQNRQKDSPNNSEEDDNEKKSSPFWDRSAP